MWPQKERKEKEKKKDFITTPGFMCAQNLGLVVSDYTVTGEVDGEQTQAPDVSLHLFAAAP